MRFDNETIAEEVKKIQGAYVPVKSGILRRLCVKSTRCSNLHPNPDDEFSVPGVGPNYEIVSEYVRAFQMARLHDWKYMDDPLIVERIYPSGYLILNGHHRWAAAQRLGYDRIFIKIVNLPQEQDVEKMIRESRHDVRVVMDLDEVVYASSDDEPTEPRLSFPYDRFFRERIRKGIPGLFRFFEKSGIDIWVYSSELYSLDHVEILFKKYHVHVDGIVTGTTRKSSKKDAQERLSKMLANKYRYTYHLDRNSIVKTHGKSGEFEEKELDCTAEDWSAKVIEAIKEMNSDVEE